jgi:predicted helicase
MTIPQYIDNISKRYKQGNATEHTFRGDLQQLIESICPTIQATNEPKRQSCGAPDYILTKKDIPVGFIEAKDIGDKDLDGLKKTGNKEQFDRYKASLNNLLFTDYLHFHLYIDGLFVTKIAIAEIDNGTITPLPQNFDSFTNLLQNFCIHIGQTIKSSKRLAEMMAGKAKLLAEIIEKALNSDEDQHENSTLKEQMQAFRQLLIHDITPKGFADVYAQTIAYGMFAARLHDPTLPTFSRQEAAELIPKSNPFLRKLFGYIAGPDLDDRIKWIVDGLVEVFLACNVEELLKNYGKSTKTENPIIHFYETFLSEYDAALRKARGVWYTPHPVVNFQVRAIDEILKTEFGLPMGIADSSKIKIKTDVQGKAVEQEVHRVQMLDPATGTGTYIAEVITLIHQKFEGQQGIWSNYVENQLLPRLIGFELLMASYAMAHLQIDLLLTETGYKPTRDQRLKIFLTNSLEESHPDTGTLFANWLSTEANEANRIKRDCPVMVVMGNPPYAVSSTNKGKWIESLTADYKKDLNERNIQPLSDDYIKFIRYGQHFIDKNGSGILAYISNNSFIDGIIHRQMRKNLLESFDKIYILDLHGNAKKKEVCSDGSADQNVFDIMQGVSINIFIKTGKKKEGKLGQLFHSDLQGKREIKYDYLMSNTLKSVNWNSLNFVTKDYFFTNKNFEEILIYEKGFKVDELLPNSANGIKTQRDDASIGFTKEECKKLKDDFIDLSEVELKVKYSYIDVRDWKISFAKNDLKLNPIIADKLMYRPFDYRYMIYTGKTKGIMGYPRFNMMRHFLKEENVGLVLSRQFGGGKHFICFITSKIIEISSQPFAPYNVFPLYLYPSTSTQQTLEPQPERVPNFNESIIEKIAQSINHVMVEEGVVVDLAAGCDGSFTPVDVLDYIYAVLHSPAYRDKYKEFLKIDFPRVPYPTNTDSFWQLVKLGGQLRQLHLLESPVVEKYITQYPIAGDNKVTKPHYTDGKVYINDTQYFDKVPELAWNFYIGGYQPAQKWLKDRKDRTLEFEDILHYQKIIVALTETGRLMKEIDAVGVEW